MRQLFLLFYIILLVFHISSCSTTIQIKRDNKDIVLNTTNFKSLDGKYSNGISFLNTINDRRSRPKNFKIDSVVLCIKTCGKKTVKLDFESNGKSVKKIKLSGRYRHGYFATNPKFSISLLPLFPILWGPGTNNLSLGLTKENNFVFLESHGGVAFFLVLPFMANGGESAHEINRLYE